MTLERKELIPFGERKLTVVGRDLQVGDQAPAFVAVANDWRQVQPITEHAGEVLVLAAVPSLDTEVCDRETRRFNEEAAALGDDVHIFVISADLPFAQKRWCGNAGVERVTTLSDSVHMDFGPKYGALIKEVRLLRRAVFVVDRKGTIAYAEYLPELGLEPEYEAVLKAVHKAR